MALLLTKAGLAALVEAEESGTKLQATHMALGDGNGSVPEHTTSSPLLINEVWRGALQSITINEQGDTDAGKQVVFEAHVPINAGGWYIREVALYAGDVLLAIGTHPVMWKPAPEEPTKMEHVIKAPVTFGNAEAVSLIVDPAVVLASQQFVKEKLKGKSDIGHGHDGEYYTQTQVDDLVKQAVPVGAEMTWQKTTLPDPEKYGIWLEQNGAAFDKAIYPELFEHLGTNVLPDMRGEFVRGWDNGRGVDAGRVLGSYQAGTKIAGEHGDPKSANGHTIHNIANVFGDPPYENHGDFDANIQFFPEEKMLVGADIAVWRTVRPRNISKMWLIKAK